eukprot:scaffold5308_cov70-Phaeocystis_antarctica.AAC.2
MGLPGRPCLTSLRGSWQRLAVPDTPLSCQAAHAQPPGYLRRLSGHAHGQAQELIGSGRRAETAHTRSRTARRLQRARQSEACAQ